MATFTNQAQITYSGGTAVSNVVTGELAEALNVTKSSFGTGYGPGETVTYAVTVTNSASTEFAGLTLTDDLGTYTENDLTLTPLTYVDGSVHYFADGVLQPAPAVTATASALTITNLTVPANGNALLIYSATANEFAPLGTGEITNTATVSGGTLAQPVSDTLSLPFTDGPILTVTKALTPAVVNENGQLTYTVTVSNTGNEAATAADNIVLTDTLNPVLSAMSVAYNGAPWAQTTNYTYDETGAFATVAGQITVPAATYTQDATTGAWSTTPGTATVAMTGTV